MTRDEFLAALWDPLSSTPPTDRFWGINFGGGTNSTALVVECVNRGFRPDWIVFADTGGERPETYEALDRLSAWLRSRDWTPISVTRWVRQQPLPDGSLTETLEEYCLRTMYLPSVAYGYAGCSTKFKRQPAEKWRKAHGYANSVFAIGFDANEHRRVNRRKCDRTDALGEEPWYPLYVWGIDRQRCASIIADAGLPPVGKSACFFCPHNKLREWVELRVHRPDLFERACAIERGAMAAGNAITLGLRRGSGYITDIKDDREAPISECVDQTVVCDCFEQDETGSPGSNQRADVLR